MYPVSTCATIFEQWPHLGHLVLRITFSHYHYCSFVRRGWGKVDSPLLRGNHGIPHQNRPERKRLQHGREIKSGLYMIILWKYFSSCSLQNWKLGEPCFRTLIQWIGFDCIFVYLFITSIYMLPFYTFLCQGPILSLQLSSSSREASLCVLNNVLVCY